MKSCQQRWSETLRDRFCVYVDVIHNIQTEHDEKISRHMFKHVDVCKQKLTRVSSFLQVRKVWFFPQNSNEKVGGESPLLKMKLNEYLCFVIYIVWSSIGMNILRKRIKHITSCSVWFHASGWLYKEGKCSYSDGLHESKNTGVDEILNTISV